MREIVTSGYICLDDEYGFTYRIARIENCENLWELLEACGMDYLNRLEWLIRTDTRYSGDLMYVIRAEEVDENIEIENLGTLESRSVELVRRLLEVICYGGNVKTGDFTIDNSNRKEFYSLLMILYLKEKKYIETRKKEGIRKAAKQGKYKGREKIKIDDSRLMEIMWEYESHKITGTEAAGKLNISLSTFNRRYREYKGSLS